MKNLEQLVMTRALVTEERRADRWDQGEWVTGLVVDEKTGFKKITCGSTACVAGWAVVTNGGRFLSDEYVVATGEDNADDLLPYTHTNLNGNMVEVSAVSVDDRAARLLGLDDSEAYDLFNGGNSYKTVKRLLKKYIEQARAERRMASDKRF